MTVSVVNVVVAPGATEHITVVDQNGNPVAPANCTIVPEAFGGNSALTSAVATYAADDTGFVFTGVAPGAGDAYVKVTFGSTSTSSAAFSVTVPSPVTAVGTTSP